jgi:hypothetical protein
MFHSDAERITEISVNNMSDYCDTEAGKQNLHPEESVPRSKNGHQNTSDNTRVSDQQAPLVES